MTMTEVRYVSEAEREKARKAGNSLPDGSYPINDVHHLHSAAVLAASHHGDWKAAMALIRRRAKELGVDVTTLPGFGGESKAGQHDPGFELRKRRRASMIRQSERRGMLLEVRAKPDGTGGTEFVFEGYGSVFDTPFQMWDRWQEPYTEIVKPGAFTRSLQRADLDVPFLIGHDESRLALARTKNGTMQLAQDSHGLHVRAQLDGRRSDVRDLAYAVERGDMDEMSIGFVTLGQEWSPDYEVRSMLDLDLHRGDVSPVALAAIPETAGSMISFPTETLSRRAAMNQAATTDAPSSDHMSPMVGPIHGEFTGVHTHGHDAFGHPGADRDGQHGHEHVHNADNVHNHLHMEAQEGTDATYSPSLPVMTGEDADRSSSRPAERRGNPVDQDMGDGPDYSADGQMKCVNMSCAHTSDYQPPAAKFCSYCGDALVRISADGLPPMEEEQGAAASLAARMPNAETLSAWLELERLNAVC